MKLTFPFPTDTDRWGVVVRRPLVPVTIRGAFSRKLVAGLLDSGGEVVVVPWDTAMEVGMHLARHQSYLVGLGCKV